MSTKYTFSSIISILLILGLALAACSSAGNPLDATSWKLTTYLDQNGDLVPILPGTVVNALFQSDQVSGLASCNNYSGEYTVEKDSLSFGPIATTRQRCAEPGVMDQEASFLAALEQVEQYNLDESTLEMLDGRGETLLVFESQ